MEKRVGAAQCAAIKTIRFYQLFISPMLGPRCRFYPSCSQYAIEAIREWGLARGILLGSKRLAKCHPLNPGGLDPVPKNPQLHPLEDHQESV